MAETSGKSGTELTVGELASMTRLTVRALRHYDSIGLLQPARVDPTNGYRYYDTGQIESASTIAVLRSLDIDVETIGHLLDGTRRLEQILDMERSRRERDERRAVSSLAVLKSMDPRHESPRPEITNAEPVTLLGRSIEVFASDDIETAGALFEELFAAASAAQIEVDPDGICIIRSSTRELLRLDVCIRPLNEATQALDGYRTVSVDGGPTAWVVHDGPLESLPLAHARLHRWILDNNARAAGHARESYLGPLADQRTRLEIPVIQLA